MIAIRRRPRVASVRRAATWRPGWRSARRSPAAARSRSAAQGAVVQLSDGREVLDFGSYAVALLGHQHPDVVAAVSGQLSLMSTSTRSLANPVTTELAARLISLLSPSRLRRVWFGQNGTDAVEVALKLARLAAGRSRILAVEGGYHGKSLGSLAATWGPRYRRGLESVLAPVTHLRRDDHRAVARETAAGDVAAHRSSSPSRARAGSSRSIPGWCADGHGRRARGRGVRHRRRGAVRTVAGRCREPGTERRVRPRSGRGTARESRLGGGVLPLSAAVCSEAALRPDAGRPVHPHRDVLRAPVVLRRGAGRARGHGTTRQPCRADRSAARAPVARGWRASFPMSSSAVRGQGLMWGLELSSSAAAGTVLTELSDGGLLVSPVPRAPGGPSAVAADGRSPTPNSTPR